MAGEEIAECAVIAEIREVHSWGSRAEETVELAMEATSDSVENIHNRLLFDQDCPTETSQLSLPFDPAL